MDLEMYALRVIILIAACDREGLYKGFFVVSLLLFRR